MRRGPRAGRGWWANEGGLQCNACMRSMQGAYGTARAVRPAASRASSSIVKTAIYTVRLPSLVPFPGWAGRRRPAMRLGSSGGNDGIGCGRSPPWLCPGVHSMWQCPCWTLCLVVGAGTVIGTHAAPFSMDLVSCVGQGRSLASTPQPSIACRCGRACQDVGLPGM